MTCLVNRTFSVVGGVSRTAAPLETGPRAAGYRTDMNKEAFDEEHHGLSRPTRKDQTAVRGVKSVMEGFNRATLKGH